MYDVNIIGCAEFWCKSGLGFVQDIVLGKEVQRSGNHNITENLPQIIAHTDASVVVSVKFVSAFIQ